MAGATINSSLTSYALPTDLTDNRSWVAIADLLEDPTTSTSLPTRTANRAAVEAHTLVARALKVASAEIEAAVTKGQRYDPTDLNNLLSGPIVTVGRELLITLCCTRAFWWLTKRRKTGARMEDIAGVLDSERMLADLENGERIFPFADTQAAGLPETAVLDDQTNQAQSQEPLSTVAFRMFGWRNR